MPCPITVSMPKRDVKLAHVESDHGAKIQSYLRKCCEYLSIVIPLSIQDSGIVSQPDPNIRLQMWTTCPSQRMLFNKNTDAKMLMKARAFLKSAGRGAILEGDRVSNTTLKQDLAEMSQVIGDIIASATKDAILMLTDENLLSAMDVLQTLVDGKYEDYGRLQKVLLRVTRKRSLLPSYLLLSDLRLASAYPLRGGGFADVYKGEYLTKAVALKVLRVGEQDVLPDANGPDGVRSAKQHKPLCKEAMIWRQFNHPNILPLYGVSDELFKPWFCLVSPWMENGDLVTFIQKNDRVDHWEIVTMIAEGLQYLHSFGNGIVHGDLRGANILIDRGGIPHIADFGLTQIVVDLQSSRLHSLSSRAGGVVNWQAPELLTFDPDQDQEQTIVATKEADVYSFSCVCLEVFTGKPPFSGLREARVISAAIIGQKPRRPLDHAVVQKGLDDRMWQIMQSCWERQPANRPTISQVLHLLYFSRLPFSEEDEH